MPATLSLSQQNIPYTHQKLLLLLVGRTCVLYWTTTRSMYDQLWKEEKTQVHLLGRSQQAKKNLPKVSPVPRFFFFLVVEGWQHFWNILHAENDRNMCTGFPSSFFFLGPTHLTNLPCTARSGCVGGVVCVLVVCLTCLLLVCLTCACCLCV